MAEPPDRSVAITRGWLAKAADDLAIAALVLHSDVGVEWALVEIAQTALQQAHDFIEVE